MKQKSGHRTDLVNNVNEVKPSKGNSRSYTVSRLQREAPELFAQVVAGTLSANAAAIQAGFRKKPTPLELLRAIWAKASNAERETFIQEITTHAT
jgi:hypothetical protein